MEPCGVQAKLSFKNKGLVTNYGEGGGLQNGRGGAQKVSAMLKGGTKSFGVVFTR